MTTRSRRGLLPRRSGISALAVASTLLGALLAAPEALGTLVKGPDGHYVSVALARGVAPASMPGSVAATRHAVPSGDNGNLDYHGGAVMHSSAPYLIFWAPSGETIAAGTESLLARYFADAAADSGGSSNVYGVDRQFYDGGGFADYRQTFSSSRAISDSQPYPANDTANCPRIGNAYCLTDAQLQTEITRLIAADGLPEDGSDPTQLPQNAPIYFVVLPTDVDLCVSSTECASNTFCAYHSSLANGSDNVLFAAIPLLPAAVDAKACQQDGNSQLQSPNGNSVGDVALKYLSHEHSETITDPVMGSQGGGGWWDSRSGQEDGDECNFYGPTADPPSGKNPNAFTPTLGGSAASGDLYNQLISSHPYYIQSEWSNGDEGCELRPSAGNIAAGFTDHPDPGDAVSLDPGDSSSSSGYSSVTWSFGDGSSSFAAGAPTPVSHTYPAPGSYDVSLTLVDPMGNVSTTTLTVTASSGGGSSGGGGGSPGGGDSGNGSSGASGSGASPAAGGASPGSGGPQASTASVMPTAAFSPRPTQPGTGQPESFSASSSNSPGQSIVAYAWSFGDGATGSGVSPMHVFKKPGTYTVTLAVDDSAGQIAFVSHQLVVTRAKVGAISVTHRTAAGATMSIPVNAPGKLLIAGKSLRAAGAGTLKFKLALSPSLRQALASAHRLTLAVSVRFTPAVGKRTTKNVTVVFRT